MSPIAIYGATVSLPLFVFLLCIPLAVLFVLKLRRDTKTALERMAHEPWNPPAGAFPSRITLRSCAEHAWNDRETAEAAIHDLRALGFEEVGPFDVENLPNQHIYGLVQQAESIRANVEEHTKIGVVVELVSAFEDGRKIYISTSKLPVFEQAPGITVRHVPGVSVARLHRLMLDERPDGPLRPVLPSHYAADYETGFAQLRDWRNLRGGFREDEIRAILTARGEEFDEARVAALCQAQKDGALLGIYEVLYRRFFAEANLTNLERVRLRDRVLIIHDLLPIEIVASAFNLTVKEAENKVASRKQQPGIHDEWLDAEEANSWAKSSPRAAFAVLNACRPGGLWVVKYGSFQEPIAADIYGPPGPYQPVKPMDDPHLLA
jgi:hypothetical protein